MLLSHSAALRPRIPALTHRKLAVVAQFSLSTHGGTPALLSHGSVLTISSAPAPVSNLGLRRGPDLGLCSLLFVISMVLGSFFSLAVVSLPALIAFRSLAVSMDKLSKVVSKEVPGTLSSLKLSGVELNDLTSQLNNIRERISGNRYGKNGRA